MDSNLIPYQPVISDIKNLIAAGQNVAYNAANRAMIMTYWNIGKRIVEEEQSGAERAEYGKRLISILSDELILVEVSDTTENFICAFLTLRFGTRVFQISTGHIFVRCYVSLTKMPVFGI